MLLRPTHGLRLLAKHDHLLLLTDDVEYVHHLCLALRVAVDSDVVEDQRTRLSAFTGEQPGHRDSQEKVHLFGGAVGKESHVTPVSPITGYANYQRLGINPNIRVAALGDFVEPGPDGIPKKWATVRCTLS